MDTFSKEKRSAIMRAVKGADTSLERLFTRALRSAKAKGWRLQQRTVSGVPDFVFRIERVAVFVDGCFWHRCPRCSTIPKSNRAYWHRKLDRNERRDKRIRRKLRAEGWSIFRIWEHRLRSNPSFQVHRVLRAVLKRRCGSTARIIKS